jgi:hypothetical protein
LQLFEAGVAEVLREADEARWMRLAFGGNGIDRFERHHIWILRQESRDLLKSSRQIWIFPSDQVDDPLIIFRDCRCWSAALGRHSRSSPAIPSPPENQLLWRFRIRVIRQGRKVRFADSEIIVANLELSNDNC